MRPTIKGKLLSLGVIVVCVLSVTLANAQVVLKDAIYLYNQNFYAGAQTGIGSYNCDVFQVVLDTDEGYTDLLMAEGNSTLSATRYPDRIYSSAPMFAYMMYSSSTNKIIYFDDKNSASTATNKVGKGTAFGYCLSSKSNASVYLYDRANCVIKNSNGTTSPISNCTPIGSSNPVATPNRTVSDFYGVVTLQYKFNGTSTTYTDSAQFSSAKVSNGVASSNVTGSSSRSMACSVLSTAVPIGGVSYPYMCLVIQSPSGDVDLFLLNLSSTYQISGVYEYCLGSLTTTQCVADMVSGPDGTVWGSVNRAGVQLSAKLASAAEQPDITDKEMAKIIALQAETLANESSMSQAEGAAVNGDLVSVIERLRKEVMGK